MNEGWVMAFARDSGTGALSHLQTLDQVGIPALEFANSVAISADGNHVYVAPRSYAGLMVFSRLGDGTLALDYSYPDQPGADPFDAIQYAYDYEGQGVPLNSALLDFSLDPVTGAIARIDEWTDQVDGATSLAVSPDARYVYLAAYVEDAVIAFVPEPGAAALAAAAGAALATLQRRRRLRFPESEERR